MERMPPGRHPRRRARQGLESFHALSAWSPDRRTGLCSLNIAHEQPIAGTSHHLKQQNTIYLFTFQTEYNVMNTPLVEFAGAGPGAEDLITLRGLRALEQADLVVYAGSLVNPGHLRRCKPDCECRDSAAMNLREQVAAMSEAALAGKRVVRLHTGDSGHVRRDQ